MTFSQAAMSLGYDEKAGRMFKLVAMGAVTIHEAAAQLCLTAQEFEVRMAEVEKVKAKANATAAD